MEHLKSKIDWFNEIATRIRATAEHNIWSDGDEILCKTKELAESVADMLEMLYVSQGEAMSVVTGFYDPAEDKRNNEEDEHTGWWCVTID